MPTGMSLPSFGSATSDEPAAGARGEPLSSTIGEPPPNTRLKLTAPVPNEYRCSPELRYASIPFVNILIRRRSLSAIR